MSFPLVLIHGYSDSAKGFRHWRDTLIEKKGLDPSRVHIVNYISLANEVTIRDIAEGFNRALTKEAGIGEDEPFDAIVHSTGMLVIRAWLTRYASMGEKDIKRIGRLRHLIALAPATNGSPVAHKGRSWIGALVKGSKDFGPDFLESGHQILSALELGSKFTWDLAEQDMFGEGNNARFVEGSSSPYVFTICGDSGLGFAADLATGAVGTKINGSDGVVRWAGAALNSRRLLIDYTGEQVSYQGNRPKPSIVPSPWNNQNNLLVLWPGLNHGDIMRPKDGDPLIDLVSNALEVGSDHAFNEWNRHATDLAQAVREAKGSKRPDQWQQLVIRVIDERGDGVDDWTISLQKRHKGMSSYESVKIDDLHPYEKDKSYRCLHLNLTDAGLDPANGQTLDIDSFKMKLSLNTGSDYLLYYAHRQDGSSSKRGSIRGLSELEVDIIGYLIPGENSFGLLKAYTTTFVEFRVNRDPLVDSNNRVKVCHLEEDA
jgi:hypothetical protein